MKDVPHPRDRLVVGTIARAHGLRGEVRVRAASDSLSSISRVFVGGRPYRIESLRTDRADFLVRFEGVADRTQAEALRGLAIEADRADIPAPVAGEVFVADLIGCAVFDLAGTRLGQVRATFPAGGHETLVVARDGGHGELLVPFVEPIVTEVDVAGRRLVCDPPEGLLDLDGIEE